MTDGQYFGYGVCIALLAVSLLSLSFRRKRPNVRVPRETLWARTNRYHEGK